MRDSLQPIIQLLQQLYSIVVPHAPLVTTPIDSKLRVLQQLSPWFNTRPPLFELEPLILACAIFFCRFVTKTGSLTGCSHSMNSGPVELVLRTLVSAVLGWMAYMCMDYDIICALHLTSHVLPWGIGKCWRSNVQDGSKTKETKGDEPSLISSISLCMVIMLCPPMCLMACRYFSSPAFFEMLPTIIPTAVKDAIFYMFPVSEMSESYHIISAFYTTPQQQNALHDTLRHLLFVTVHIQFGLGHIGIDFLTSEQKRKNMLIRMDVDNPPPDENGIANRKDNVTQNQNGTNDQEKKKKFDPSRKFRRSAPTFILFTVIPYMFQIILFGNLNNFSFMYVRNQIHNKVRIDELFNHDSHLEALASESATSPDAYASSMDKVVSTAYDILNRKLFSLPKLILLPSVISRKPALLVRIFPFILLTDILKGRLVASVTSKVEEFRKEAQDLNSVRQKVEQYDMKNADLLRRSGIGSTQFTQKRWSELTIEHQAKMASADLLSRTRSFYMWLQRNFVFVALIDCALAELLASSEIVVAEIFVFSRAIEDVVDLLLIRSRSESELATLMTQVDKLKGLENAWSKSKVRTMLPCRIDEASGKQQGVVLRNLEYSRGSADVMIEKLIIEPGIYAVTGANGSGKSTLFRLLMSCETNERPIDLHDSIKLTTPVHSWVDLSEEIIIPEDSCKASDEDCKVEEKENFTQEIPVTSITMPSSDVVEISQVFYWPLYTAPIDWIYQQHITTHSNATKHQARAVAIELQSLSFSQSQNNPDSKDNAGNADALEVLTNTLQETKEDWFSELSGGQKSKVELVRKVFLRERCPSVLLIDETMAPLDPASKSQVMARLKDFCSDSVVLVSEAWFLFNQQYPVLITKNLSGYIPYGCWQR